MSHDPRYRPIFPPSPPSGPPPGPPVRPQRRDWFGTVFGVLFLIVAALVMLPWVLAVTTPDQIGQAFRWVLAPALLLLGVVGLRLATRRGNRS